MRNTPVVKRSRGYGAFWQALRLGSLQYGLCILVRQATFCLASAPNILMPSSSPCPVGMLACGLDVKIGFNVTLTILSAVVAIVFTFAAFSTAYTTEALENSAPMQKLTKWGRSLSHAIWSLLFTHRQDMDVESGRDLGFPSQSIEERRPILASTSDNGENNNDDESERPQNDVEHQGGEFTRPQLMRNTSFAEHEFPHSSTEFDTLEPPPRNATSEPSYFSAIISAPFRVLRRARSPPPPEHPDRDAFSARTSEDSTPLATTDSSDDSTSVTRRASVESSGQLSSGTPTTLSSHSWSDPLHAGLSREARLRIKAQARDKPVPNFGWRYWFKQYYSSVSLFVVIRAAVWGLAIVFMHYCGMSELLRDSVTVLIYL